MKRINAQWTFLIILALWIPVLCFADESDPQLIDTIEMEQGEYRIWETDPNFVGPPAPDPASEEVSWNELPTWKKIYYAGIMFIFLAGGFSLLFSVLTMMWYSLKINYYLYINHGEFAFWFSGSDYEVQERRREIYQEYCKSRFNNVNDPSDADMLGWWCAWLLLILGTIILVIVSLLWPLAVIGFAPAIFVRAIAYKKRKKQVFQDKLKGNETNGVV